MTPRSPALLDGWLWPSDVPAPEFVDETRAGGAIVRYPRPDPASAHTLASALRKAQGRLADRTAAEIAQALGRAARRLRQELDEEGPSGGACREAAENARLSVPMIREVMTEMIRSWSGAGLARLVRAEFRDADLLEGFAIDGGRRVRASGRALVVHVGAGSVPGLTIGSICRSLVVKSAVLAKPGAGDVALTVRFARILAEIDPALATAVAVQYWPGGESAHDQWERAVLHLADQVVVHGSDAAVEAVRARAPATTRLTEHPNRLGVAVVDPAADLDAAKQAARAVALFDQRGCVSAHLFLLLAERPEAEAWCKALAHRLAALDASLPPAPSDMGAQSAVRQLHGRLAVKRAASADVNLWAAPDLGWSVILAGVEHFEPVGSRTAWVVPASGRDACTRMLAGLSPVLQTVGLAGVAPDSDFAEALFGLGASRIVPLDQMPFPDADWLHDGSRPLGDLVRWCELR